MDLKYFDMQQFNLFSNKTFLLNLKRIKYIYIYIMERYKYFENLCDFASYVVSVCV